MSVKKYALDPGADQIRLCGPDGTIYTQASYIAVRNKGETIAAGDEAAALFEKASPDIRVCRPFKEGPSDTKEAVHLLKYTIHGSGIDAPLLKNTAFYIAAAHKASSVQLRTLSMLAESFGVRHTRVFLIPKPVAAAAGADINVHAPSGCLIADLGASFTELSVVSLGEVADSTLLHDGGSGIDMEIIETVRSHFNFQIGTKTACALKIALADARGDTPLKAMAAYGKNLQTGLPGCTQIPAGLICESVRGYYDRVVTEIRLLLERISPELTSDVIRGGLYLTGGMALVPNAAAFFSSQLRMPAHLCPSPGETVIRGLYKLMTQKQPVRINSQEYL